jgi:SAM-dependent methyltransferase
LDEASKTMALYPKLLTDNIHGRILDIGAGLDPITKNAEVFDKAQGDAQEVLRHFPKESFDTVFSSHCLEHMVDPLEAVTSWYSLVKPGGQLIVIVPDEDLYEQGHFPSIFNSDHKATFTISKSKSWSSKSVNCLELCTSLRGEIVYLAQQLDNYEMGKRSYKKLGMLKFRITRQVLRINTVRSLAKKLKLIPVDQTSQSNSTLAQICFIVKKS